MKERRPAYDVEHVHVTESMHVAPCVEHRPHDLDVSMGSCPMQWIRVVSSLACVWVGTVLQQKSHDLDLAALRCLVKRRPTGVGLIRMRGLGQAEVLREEL